MTTLPVSGIRVTNRYRRDLGDLASLRESIESLGLLQPVVVRADGTLVAGHRRLVACQSLGMTDIPVTVVEGLDDAISLVSAERDENICRLAMKPSELVALGLELERLEKPKAIERQQRGGQRGGQASGKLPEASPPIRDVIGKALGWGGRTYGEAKTVVETANNPEESAKVRSIARSAMSEMDESGKVSPAYRKLAEAKNPDLRPKHPKDTGPRSLTNRKPKAGKRSVRSAIASIRKAAIDVDAVASGFEADAFGELSVITSYREADEWFDLLAEANQRLGGHLRTIKRYRNSREEEAG